MFAMHKAEESCLSAVDVSEYNSSSTSLHVVSKTLEHETVKLGTTHEDGETRG